METKRTITLHAQEIKKEKQTFIACSAEINNTWYKVKFTKECANAPRTRGLYELTIDFDMCSVEAGKKYTNKKGKEAYSNPTIWVRGIVDIRKHTEEELRAKNRDAMNAIFGTNPYGDSLEQF